MWRTESKSCATRPQGRSDAFTLVELLVVIGIIAMLIAMLMPALSAARSNAMAVQCQSNLRQLFVAQTFYADENSGWYTPVEYFSPLDDFVARLAKYLGEEEGPTGSVYQCPVAAPSLGQYDRSYGINTHLMLDNWMARRDRTRNPSEKILLADKGISMQSFLVTEDKYHMYYWPSFNPAIPAQRWWMLTPAHSGDGAHRHGRYEGVNAVMADGHVRRLGREELMRDSGHWYWDTPELQVFIDNGLCCQ